MKNKLMTVLILIILLIFTIGCTQQDNSDDSAKQNDSTKQNTDNNLLTSADNPPVDSSQKDTLLGEINDADIAVEESGTDEIMDYDDVIQSEIP